MLEPRSRKEFVSIDPRDGTRETDEGTQTPSWAAGGELEIVHEGSHVKDASHTFTERYSAAGGELRVTLALRDVSTTLVFVPARA